MSKTTLNAKNLEALGAAQLAVLVMDLVKGNAALQRRARLELSASQGAMAVASDLRKRFASLRRATKFVSWHKQRALVKDLRGLLGMIETKIAPEDAGEAFELLWSFLRLAPSLYERCDDSNGEIGSVMDETMELIAKISPALTLDSAVLAEQILDAVAEAGYGEFDGVIPAMADALGQGGLEHLKALTKDWAGAPPSPDDIKRYRDYGFGSDAAASARRSKDSTASVILADIADAQGDVNAYMARYSPEQLTYHTIAPDVARRLLDADRVNEAFEIITKARSVRDGRSLGRVNAGLDDVYEACLERLGDKDALKSHLWERFESQLHAPSLRGYLKSLPDFEDIEAEDRALALVEDFPGVEMAIRFLLDWPAHDRAAKVVLAKYAKLDGNQYQILNHAANQLDGKYSLAATLLRREMILDTLEGAKSKRYKHAARHLAECHASDAQIEDYGNVQDHQRFVERLKNNHARKQGFWGLVDN